MISRSLADTAKIAGDIAGKLKVGKTAVVLALSGDLGSGKTTFAKAFAAELGVSPDDVTSPTFVIMKSYEIVEPRALMQGWMKLIHIDAYRLETPAQAAQIGWDKLVADPSNIILVEWPEKIGEVGLKIAKNIRTISFKFIDEQTREISL